MHAASVNPEPGSNSLKNCISYLKVSLKLIPFSELFCLASSYFFEYFSQCVLNEIPLHFSVRSEISCCSIFNDRLLRFPRSACLLYYIIPLLSSLFPLFFELFSKWEERTKTTIYLMYFCARFTYDFFLRYINKKLLRRY